MTPTIQIQELSIAIVAAKHNPTFLTLDFLKGSGIVPDTWEVARFALLNPQTGQLAFTNGVNLVAQPGNITFSESLINQNIGQKAIEDVQIPDIIRKYVEKLPQLDYKAISFNPRSFVTFENGNQDNNGDNAGDNAKDENAARTYIISKLLAPGPWLDIGEKTAKATLKLNYILNGQPFNLTIDEAQLQLADQPAKSAILLTGNFPRKIAADQAEEQAQALGQRLDSWQQVLETYREIVNQRVLGQSA